MNFVDIKVDKDERFSIGVEECSGKHYLSIPVSNPYVDYEEYYHITKDMFDEFEADMKSAKSFVEQCRNREKDELLLQQPGKLRGTPI